MTSEQSTKARSHVYVKWQIKLNDDNVIGEFTKGNRRLKLN